MGRWMGGWGVGLAVVWLGVTPTQAALLLAIDAGGTLACASDNNTGCAFGTPILDVDPTVGVMSFGPNPVLVGVLAISGSVQQVTLGPPQNILNTSSTQITNTSGAAVSGFFAVSATGYTPPVSTAFASGSATWQNAIGSTIAMGWYNDPLDGQGAETATDTPGIQFFACTDTVTLAADGTSCVSGAVPVVDLLPFSMTLATQFSLVGGATLVNRGQTAIKDVVPEPASLALLGMGLVGLGAFARKRRK